MGSVNMETSRLTCFEYFLKNPSVVMNMMWDREIMFIKLTAIDMTKTISTTLPGNDDNANASTMVMTHDDT